LKIHHTRSRGPFEVRSKMVLSPSDNVCKSHDALCSIWFNGAIGIEHAIIVDLPDGTPVLPGFVNDGIFWALVARLSDGRTRWRRIYLQTNTVLPIGVADETVNHRRHETKGHHNETR
jgi:hypothetical protein